MKILIWQQDIIDREKRYSNKQLFDDVIMLGNWGGDRNGREDWEYDYLLMKLEERLTTWLKQS